MIAPQPTRVAPDFTLPPETVQALYAFADRHEIAGAAGFVDEVQRACRRFLVYRENEAQRLATGKRNRMVREVGEHARSIKLLLDHPEVLRRVEGDVYWLTRMGQDRFWLQRGGEKFLRELCDNLAVLARVGEPSKGGRPKGSRKSAGFFLATALCDCLGRYGVPVRQVTENGVPAGEAHQLLDILRGPLDLEGGQLNGIFNDVAARGYHSVFNEMI